LLSLRSIRVLSCLFHVPTILAWDWQPPRVICFWRRTQRDLAGCRYSQAADSAARLPENPKLEARSTCASRAVNGSLSPPRRPSPQFFAGSGQKPVLLLWLRPRRRSHPLRRTFPRRQISRGDGVASPLLSIGVPVIRCGPLLPDA